MPVVKNPDVMKWQCGRCETWNNVEAGVCTKCKAPASMFARAFRMKNLLTEEEKGFYSMGFPGLMRDMTSMRRSVENIEKLLKEMLSRRPDC